MRCLLSSLVVLGVVLGSAIPVGRADTLLIAEGSVWAFRKGTAAASEPADAWRLAGHDDAAWPKATAPFYYDTSGGYTGRTQLTDMRNGYTSLYLRRGFVLTNAAAVGSLGLRFLCDDGFVLWINGTRVAAHNQTVANPAHDALATSAASEPLDWLGTTLANPSAYLVEGYNQVAVQAFNVSRTSSDFILDLELTAALPDAEPPRIASVVPPPDTTIEELSEVTVRFTEPVGGIGFSDLLVNGRPATGLRGSGDTWTFTLEPVLSGRAEITWDDGAAITDFASPPNRFAIDGPGARWGYAVVDTRPPRIVRTLPPPGVTVREMTEVEVLFSETVTGVAAGDLRVDGQPATAVTGEGAGPYRFVLPTLSPGTVQLAWSDESAIEDASGNRFAGDPWSVTVDPEFTFQPVVISEFLAVAAGDGALRDEDDEVQDWIELHNRGEVAVDLGGWALTDDPDRPGQWVFPQVTVPAGGRLVVFASGKDRRTTGAGRRLHTNFRLGGDGEYLGLLTADAPRRVASEFGPAYPVQRADHSYGIPDGAAEPALPAYFPSPTPGTANTGPTVAGIVPPVTVNVARGFFTVPFALHLACELGGAEIRYTTDGQPPTAGSGRIYSGPIDIADTTVLRVAAFAPGRLPSEVATHTYVFPDRVLRQPARPPGVPSTWIDTQGRSWEADYGMDPEIVDDPAYAGRVRDALLALPSISIVTAPGDLFDNANGIYPKSMARGPAWERAASVEFLFPGGGDTLQVDCGVQMQGNSVRDPVKTGKHAFRLVFKRDYGPGRLRLKVFPDSPVTEFNTLTVRADFNNSWMHWNGEQRPRGMRVRDAFMKDSYRDMGQLASHSRFFHLYLNGLYWGVYDPTERPDSSFAASYLGGRDADYDVMNEGQLVDGSRAAYDTLRGLTGVNTPAGYARVADHLDIPAYVDYVLLHFYTGHEDWFTDKNWYAIRRRAPGAGYRYLPWDGELMLNSPTRDITTRTDQPSGLHQKLLASAEYRLTFADRAQRHLFGRGALTPAAVADRYQRRADQVARAMVAESARWGDYRRDVHAYSSGPYLLYTVDQHFESERQRLLTQYFPQRTAIVLAQLKTAGLYPANTLPPTLPSDTGVLPAGHLIQMGVPAGTVHYTLDGSDPRVAHTGAVASGARVYSGPFPVQRSTVVRARTLRNGEWSALVEASYTVGTTATPLRVTEIHYNPVEGDPYEFIELHHLGDLPLDASGFSVDGIGYVFPQGSLLQPGAVVLLASDRAPDAFALRHPGVRVDGYFAGSLANGGERITLRDADGRTVLAITFDDDPPWPAGADGGGASLELRDPELDPDSPAAWRAGPVGGSPGQVPDPEPPPVLRLNEIQADNAGSVPNAGSFPDWVELHNAGDTGIDLGGWTLADGGPNPPFEFPVGTQIPAAGYLVVWCDDATGNPGLHTGFGLGRDADVLLLRAPDGRVADAIGYGPQLPDLTLARDAGGGWGLGRPTPGAANEAMETASALALRINEWLADPPPGEPDWIELHLPGGDHPVALSGLTLEAPGAVASIRAPGFVAPGGFVRLFADGPPGGDNLAVRLPAAGATLMLRDGLGREIHSLTYGPQLPGITAGLFPDGTGPTMFFPGSPTPGGANVRVTRDSVLLSEILTQASDGAPGWIELHNPTGQAVDLSGHELAVGNRDVRRWTFPHGVVLPAGGFLRIDCNPGVSASTEPGPELNSALVPGVTGDAIVLAGADGRILDEITFGPQVAGRTIGRQAGLWRLLAMPTPGGANSGPVPVVGAAGRVRINEWLANGPADDWIELYNPSPETVLLTGVSVSDRLDIFQLDAFRFGPLSFLGPGGFLRLDAAASTGNNPTDLGFALAATGEALALSSADGVVFESVTFGPQLPGVSEGRLPDGGDTIVRFHRNPSPGSPNLSDDANPTPPRVAGMEVDGGILRLEVTGPAGSVLVLESSGDLLGWNSVGNRLIGPEPIVWEVPFDSLEAGRFFRVRRQ